MPFDRRLSCLKPLSALYLLPALLAPGLVSAHSGAHLIIARSSPSSSPGGDGSLFHLEPIDALIFSLCLIFSLITAVQFLSAALNISKHWAQSTLPFCKTRNVAVPVALPSPLYTNPNPPYVLGPIFPIALTMGTLCLLVTYILRAAYWGVTFNQGSFGHVPRSFNPESLVAAWAVFSYFRDAFISMSLFSFVCFRVRRLCYCTCRGKFHIIKRVFDMILVFTLFVMGTAYVGYRAHLIHTLGGFTYLDQSAFAQLSSHQMMTLVHLRRANEGLLVVAAVEVFVSAVMLYRHAEKYQSTPDREVAVLFGVAVGPLFLTYALYSLISQEVLHLVQNSQSPYAGAICLIQFSDLGGTLSECNPSVARGLELGRVIVTEASLVDVFKKSRSSTKNAPQEHFNIQAYGHVCHKLNEISRERHLWLRLTSRAHVTLSDIDKMTDLELEKALLKPDVLEKKWEDKTQLSICPPFQRSSRNGHNSCGTPVAIMGDYIVIQGGSTYKWLSILDMDSEPDLILETKISPQWLVHQLDHACTTFTLVCPSISPDINLWRSPGAPPVLPETLRVVEVGPDDLFGLPTIVNDYSLPLKSPAQFSALTLTDMVVCVDYRINHDIDQPHDVPLELELFDLERKVSEAFLINQNLLLPEKRFRRTLRFWADKAWVYMLHGENDPLLAVFRRHEIPGGMELSGSRKATVVEPVFRGILVCGGVGPWDCRVFCRSPTRLAIVTFQRWPVYRTQESIRSSVEVSLFFVDLSMGEISRNESFRVPGRSLESIVFHRAPASTRCILGAMSVKTANPASATVGECDPNTYYALRVEFLSSGDSEDGRISAVPISLAPALGHRDDVANFQYLDVRSGRLLLQVHRPHLRAHEYGPSIDACSWSTLLLSYLRNNTSSH
ncbi:hypothetical protein NP233_g2174 [Leucocoprinus birnbaumii]|uniref:Uncharacterized protein n=1 Tax=Leucocoprinus birnbaumii TaxID=56174 RepID=A0AAD5W2S3_9AGAR|nr:hypothetical protein NP233_g2174 [Leucocoprinus birnbaumii]